MGLLLGLRRLSSLSAFESFFLRDNLNVFVVTVKVVIGGARTCVGNAGVTCFTDSRLCGFCQSLLLVRSISRQSTIILPGHLQFLAESPPFRHLQVCLQLANVFILIATRWVATLLANAAASRPSRSRTALHALHRMLSRRRGTAHRPRW